MQIVFISNLKSCEEPRQKWKKKKKRKRNTKKKITDFLSICLFVCFFFYLFFPSKTFHLYIFIYTVIGVSNTNETLRKREMTVQIKHSFPLDKSEVVFAK